MKKLIMAVLVLTQTACATSVNLMASLYDNADVCQKTELLKTDPQKYRTYCSGGYTSKTYTTRDYYWNRPLVTTR